jgi:2-keto-4-pentenoate hydratase
VSGPGAGAIDPRIARGTAAMLELRRARLAMGDRAVGWKIGFGSSAAFELLGIDRPLVGFLTDRGLVEDGATVPVGDWTQPMLEPEIAVHLAGDVEGDASHDDVRAAIRGLSAAIELADVDTPPADPEPIVAGNIFHRHVLLGPVDEGRTTAGGVRGRLLRGDEEIAATEAPEAATGELAEVVLLTAELLAERGERLRAGDVVITGSIVPPVKVAPGERITAEIEPLGALTVAIGE